MRLPGRIRPGQKIATLASSVDLMPTMNALCGLKSPSSCMGRDLSGAVTGGGGPQVDSVYAMGAMRAEREMPPAPANAKKKSKKGQAVDAEAAEDEAPGGEWRAIVTPTHKLVTNMSGKLQLWDLEKDPYELKNLAEERSATALKNDLLAKMKRWGADTGDPYPRVARMAADKYTDEQAAKARG
jgi:arylsulfatase A-like enzyme